MKTFVMMTKLAPADALLVDLGSKMQGHARKGRSWIEQIKEKCPEVHFKAHYALLGHWDYMDIYEAPDDETAAKVTAAGLSHRLRIWLPRSVVLNQSSRPRRATARSASRLASRSAIECR